MVQQLKRLVTDTALYAITTMGNKFVSALIAPLFAFYLSKTQVATVELTNSILMILGYVCILGTDAAMAFYYFDVESEERRKYLTTAVLFSLFLCTTLTFFVFIFDKPMSDLIFKSTPPDGDSKMILPVAFLATLGAIIIQHLLGYSRYARKIYIFNIFSIAYVVGSNLLSVYFVLFVERSPLGYFCGQLIGQGTVAMALLLVWRKEFIFTFSKKHLLDLISYGLPLLPSLLSFWILTSSGRTFLYYLDTPGNVAVYSYVLKIASFINLITAPFFLAWRPFSMSIKDNEDASEIFGIVAKLLLVVGTIAIMCVQFVSKPLIHLYLSAEGYESVYLYVWTLSFATILNVLQNVLGTGLLINKETNLISRGFVIAAVINSMGCFILVPLYQIWGAVTMTLISYLFVLFWVIKKNQAARPINISILSILIYIIIYLLCMASISWVQVNGVVNEWIVYAIVFFVIVLTAFLTKLISISYIKSIIKILPFPKKN